MAKSFSAAVGKWATQTPQRIAAVRRRSIELLADEMTRTKPQGGRVPVDTGNLSRSLVASTESMPKTSEPPTQGFNVGAVTALLRNDQPLWLGYTAVYARRMNYGMVGSDKLGRVYNQSGNYFVEGAIAEWPNIVRKAAREIKQAVTTR